MDFIDLPQLLSARGSVRLPGSKSISNRVLLLAALAEGTTEIRDLLISDDTRHMLDALSKLGVRLSQESSAGNATNHEDASTLWQNTGAAARAMEAGKETEKAAETKEGALFVHGVGGVFPQHQAELFLGNAGTAFRSLTAALALLGGTDNHFKLSGIARMHERPIGDLVDALRQVGAEIRYTQNDGFPPLEIFSRQAQANLAASQQLKVRGDVSSQFLTGILMALPLLGSDASVEVIGELISKPYIEITLAIMARFGVQVQRQGWQGFSVSAGAKYRSPGVVYVEGDASSASYFLALGALAGGPVRVEGVGQDSIQGDVRFAEALAQMGAQIKQGANWIEAAAPASQNSAQSSAKLRGISLDCNAIPDAAMTLAVAALFAEGTTTLSNIASWRVKETDRIAAMQTELRKLGASVEVGADFIRITPPATASDWRAAAIDTYDDHRIAMCFSLASVATPLRINEPQCVSKTFPDYFATFRQLGTLTPVIAIDGPSASGKGTVAARVAAALGWHYLDSGALYRLTALAAQHAGVAWDDEVGVAAVASRLNVVFGAQDISLIVTDARTGAEHAMANANERMRSESISSGASQIAALPAVRAALLLRQRAFRCAPGLVADGRDMGSVVFPDAAHKIYLTADLEVRATRRYKQLIEKGIAATMPPLLQDLRDRDERDTQRHAAPLRQSKDAKYLDTTQLSIDNAVAQVLAWYHA
ncbi:MAG: 3-phosphoshikimate 1-carboxyvinyltransferase [Pseudomonadota bacterium]